MKKKNDELKKRLRKLTDSVTEPPAGEMAAAYALQLADADQFVALTSLLPPELVVRALLGPFPSDPAERERMMRRKDAVRALLLGGERKAAEAFLARHAKEDAAAIDAVAGATRRACRGGAPDSQGRAAIALAIAAGRFSDVFPPDTWALLVLARCADLLEKPLAALLAKRDPPAAELKETLQRRADMLALLAAAFAARPIVAATTTGVVS